MMAQKKVRKHSSSLEQLRGKTAEELADILARPSLLVQFVNKSVEERARRGRTLTATDDGSGAPAAAV